MSGSNNSFAIPTKPNNLLPIDKRIRELEDKQSKALNNVDMLFKNVNLKDTERMGIVFLELAAKHQSDIIQLERIIEDRKSAEASNRQAKAQNRLSVTISIVAVGAAVLQTIVACIGLIK